MPRTRDERCKRIGEPFRLWAAHRKTSLRLWSGLSDTAAPTAARPQPFVSAVYGSSEGSGGLRHRDRRAAGKIQPLEKRYDRRPPFHPDEISRIRGAPPASSE